MDAQRSQARIAMDYTKPAGGWIPDSFDYRLPNPSSDPAIDV